MTCTLQLFLHLSGVDLAQILTCSEQTKLCALCAQASEELLKEHYIALRDRPFYSRLVKYMSSGPVVAMVSAG